MAWPMFGVAAVFLWLATRVSSKAEKAEKATANQSNTRISIMQRLRNISTLSEEEQAQPYDEIYALSPEEFIYLNESLDKCSWYVSDPKIKARLGHPDIVQAMIRINQLSK